MTRPAVATGRLFVALWPGPATLRALVDWRARQVWPAGTVEVPPERLHLTLHFIGPVARERWSALAAALSQPTHRFELVLGRAELWPGGVVVMCPRAVPEALLALHSRLAEVLRQLDLPVETRLFRPHLTLARHCAAVPPPGAVLDWRWPVRTPVLVRSAQGYQVLARLSAPV